MMITSGIWGPEVYGTALIRPFPFLAGIVDPETSIRDVWVPVILGAFFIAHLPACVKNVARARKERGEPLFPVILEWTPIVVFTASCSAWLGSPHSWLLKDNHLTLWCVTMSMVFGRMTTKIILAHLTRQPFPWWTVLLTPLVGGAIISNLPYLGFAPLFDQKLELLYLWTYFIFAFVVYGRWAHLVITSICDYLGIYALTIPREKWQNPGAGIIGSGGSADLSSGSPKRD
jgi:ethanolaminephosphotransferase